MNRCGCFNRGLTWEKKSPYRIGRQVIVKPDRVQNHRSDITSRLLNLLFSSSSLTWSSPLIWLQSPRNCNRRRLSTILLASINLHQKWSCVSSGHQSVWLSRQSLYANISCSWDKRASRIDVLNDSTHLKHVIVNASILPRIVPASFVDLSSWATVQLNSNDIINLVNNDLESAFPEGLD